MKEKLDLSLVIFENDLFLILNKPSGMVVHPFDFSSEKTVLDFLIKDLGLVFVIENKKILQDERVVDLGGIVHKLDRETSGIMVIAKTQEVFNELSFQFRNHLLQKTYIALVEGNIEKDSFVIDAPLGRNKKEYKQSVNPKNLRGELREAITLVSVIERRNESTLVRLFPKTGRTHQLRAHMSSVGNPIIGDNVYGSTVPSSRIMLHAESLSFTVCEKEYEFKVEKDNEFNKQ